MSHNDVIINIRPSDEKSTTLTSYHSSTFASYKTSNASSEEDLKHRPVLNRENTQLRKFLNEAVAVNNENLGYDGEVYQLRWLGRVCTKIKNFSIVTKYALYILPVAFLLSIPLIIFGTVKRDSRIQGVKIMGLFIWLEIIWCGLWLAKLFSKLLPGAFRVCCGVISAGTRKHSMIIEALEIPLSIFFWVIISWATIPVIVRNFNQVTVTSSTIYWISKLQKAFMASIPAAGIYLIEKILIEFLAVTYHRTQFSAKIQDNKRRIRLFELLYKASTILYPENTSKMFIEDDRIIHEGILSTIAKGISTAEGTYKMFDNISRMGTGLTSVFGNIVREVTGAKKQDPKSAHGVVTWALERKESCEALARRVFKSLVANGHDAIYQRDIESVIEEQTEAEEIFQALDKDGNGDVSQEEVVMMVIDLMNSQVSVIRSLHDVDRAIKALDRILLCVVLVGAGMLYATFFSENFFKSLSLYTASIMSFSFAFAGTVQEFTGSCIFLFVKHPYDVGDRVEINSIDMVVEHISLLYTIFRRIDTNRNVQIPNIVNNGVWVENISRSKSMKEHISLSISAGTSIDDIGLLRKELRDFIVAEENKRDYTQNFNVEVVNVGDMSKLELKINIEYKSNWSDETLCVRRRSKFMCALLATMRRIQIEAPGGGGVSLGDVSRPAYSVSVSDEEAKAARAAYLEEKAAKKYIPGKDKVV